MKTNINLIVSVEAEKVRKGKTIGIFRAAAVIAVILAGISSAIVFLLSQQFSPAAIKKQQAGVSASLNSLRSKQAKLILLNNNLVDIQGIIDKRPNYDKTMGKIVGLIPSGIEVNTLNIDNQTISLTVISSSLLPLNNLTDSFIGLVREKDLIKNLNIQNISADTKGGVYSLSIKAEKI